MICAKCPAETIVAKDGLCRPCRLRMYQVVKYPWTPEMDAALTRAYRGAKSKTDLSARLTELGKRFRYPRYILWNRATTLDLRRCLQKFWTEEELLYLRDHSSEISVASIARHLGRSHASVKNKLFSLDLSGQVSEGFSQNELAKLFGVHHAKIERWLGRGWLELDREEMRITHDSVERFVWDHMNEYHFASCEEWWLKTMLKPSIGHIAVARAA